jgi:hypothetical protein
MGASIARLEANRRNALSSTGPRSLAGKRRVAANAVRHGLTSQALLLPGEDADAFAAFESELLASLDPRDSVEALLAGRVVVAAWRLHRIARVEAGMFATRVRMSPGDSQAEAMGHAFVGAAAGSDAFTKLSRYEASLDRAFVRALRELHRVQAERRERDASVVDGGVLDDG